MSEISRMGAAFTAGSSLPKAGSAGGRYATGAAHSLNESKKVAKPGRVAKLRRNRGRRKLSIGRGAFGRGRPFRQEPHARPGPPGQPWKRRPNDQRQRRTLPSQMTHVSQIGAKQWPQPARQQADVEIAEQRAPAVARGPERASKRHPPARARSLVPGDCRRIAREAVSGAGQSQRQIDIFVVGKEGPSEDFARRRNGREGLSAIERGRRGDSRHLESDTRRLLRLRARKNRNCLASSVPLEPGR